jgi:hypothetical protein
MSRLKRLRIQFVAKAPLAPCPPATLLVGLLSEDNRWVNARRIEVSGGQGI